MQRQTSPRFLARCQAFGCCVILAACGLVLHATAATAAGQAVAKQHARFASGQPARLAPLPSPAPNEYSSELPEPDSADQPLKTWWDAAVHQPLEADVDPIPITLDQLLMGALAHSAQIRVIKEAPLIRETAIVEADAEFDWATFIESQFVDTSDPVGNQLQTGGPTRFREHDFSTSVGLRRKNRIGGRFDIAQEVGHRDNNSVFFLPPNQGNSRLTISYTQPLLNGGPRLQHKPDRVGTN